MKRFKINKKTFLWAVLIGLMGTVILTSVQAAAFRAEKEELQQRLDREIQEGIAEEIFRLHVVANSDSQEDQDGVLENRSDRENAAAETIKSQGETYPVAASVETTYFPDKTYGDCTFPAGEYEALNIRIGKAEGKNWWCVLYPSLCFIDDTWGIVSQEKKEELKEVLTEEEFQAILGNPEEKKKVRVGFKWF